MLITRTLLPLFAFACTVAGCVPTSTPQMGQAVATVAQVQSWHFKAPDEGPPRYLAFVSDHHMGLGKVDENWHPYEDFRWPRAMAGFLEEISERGRHRVDLVILGDFLELWQTPSSIKCDGNAPGLGCSVEEIVQVTKKVVDAHSGTDENQEPRAIESLKIFSERGDNRLYLLPGNHDAAILLPEVWTIVGEALGARSGRVKLVGAKEGAKEELEGIATFADGQIVVEHGHQIGADLNRYKNWPTIIDAETGRLIRLAGELNVQKIFNDVEKNYSIIDNLSPETKGAWYRMQDRGFWGTIADVAQLSLFLIFETSLEHKGDYLGKGKTCRKDPVGNCIWDDEEYIRDILRSKLIAYALPETDNIRAMLLSRGNIDPLVKALRAELDLQVKNMPLADLKHLCDQVYLQSDHAVCDPTLGAVAEATFMSRTRILQEHLEKRRRKYPNMRVFIYGHTHQLEKGHTISLADRDVTVFNTGAFQRVMDSDNYERRLKDKYPGTSTGEGLSVMSLEKDFRPCYTTVLVPFVSGPDRPETIRWHIPFEDGYYRPETVRWHMAEDGEGQFVEVGDAKCQW